MELRKAILATIAYYDRLEYPLTLFEVHRFLINPGRLFPKVEPLGDIGIGAIAAGLDKLVELDLASEKYGMYALPNHAGLASQRLEREKIAAQKWRRFARKAHWLQLVPWLCGMFASGSLALGNTTEASDFDVLVVAAPKRIFLTRLALSAMASLMGVRRKRYDASAPDKFCFNHYVVSDQLEIRHQSLYNAQTYAHLIPVWPDARLAGEFSAANLWLNKYLYNFKPHQEMINRGVVENKFLRGIAHTIEKTFDNKFGDWLECLARSYQQKRIAENPLTFAPGGRVVATDTELEFHPNSFERAMLDSYNKTIQRLAISTITEPDSGLN